MTFNVTNYNATQYDCILITDSVITILIHNLASIVDSWLIHCYRYLENVYSI